MGLPRSNVARRFYSAGKQRFEDGEVLLNHGRTVGATYLAGYGVECQLKALILSKTPERKQPAILQQFRGQQAHDFESLLHMLRVRLKVNVPADIGKLFARIRSWKPSLRYESGTMKKKDVDAFFDAAAKLICWIDERT
jgi:hypothetical protein